MASPRGNAEHVALVPPPATTVAYWLLAVELNIKRRYNIKHGTRMHANGPPRPHSGHFVRALAHTHTPALISDVRHGEQRQWYPCELGGLSHPRWWGTWACYRDDRAPVGWWEILILEFCLICSFVLILRNIHLVRRINKCYWLLLARWHSAPWFTFSCCLFCWKFHSQPSWLLENTNYRWLLLLINPFYSLTVIHLFNLPLFSRESKSGRVSVSFQWCCNDKNIQTPAQFKSRGIVVLNCPIVTTVFYLRLGYKMRLGSRSGKTEISFPKFCVCQWNIEQLNVLWSRDVTSLAECWDMVARYLSGLSIRTSIQCSRRLLRRKWYRDGVIFLDYLLVQLHHLEKYIWKQRHWRSKIEND